MTAFSEQLAADVDEFVKNFDYEPAKRIAGFEHCNDDSARTFHGKRLPTLGTVYRTAFFPRDATVEQLPELFVTLHHFANSFISPLCKDSVKVCVRHETGPEGCSNSFCETIEEAYTQALKQLCWETLHRPKTSNYVGLRLRG